MKPLCSSWGVLKLWVPFQFLILILAYWYNSVDLIIIAYYSWLLLIIAVYCYLDTCFKHLNIFGTSCSLTVSHNHQLWIFDLLVYDVCDYCFWLKSCSWIIVSRLDVVWSCLNRSEVVSLLWQSPKGVFGLCLFGQFKFETEGIDSSHS